MPAATVRQRSSASTSAAPFTDVVAARSCERQDDVPQDADNTVRPVGRTPPRRCARSRPRMGRRAGRRAADPCTAPRSRPTPSLKGRVPPAALITSQGFRHVLEIGRHDIPRKANMSHVGQAARGRCRRELHLRGRRPYAGAMAPSRPPLDEAAVHTDRTRAAASGLRTIAICLLNWYANPAHEQRVRDILRERMPDALISLSSDVLPVFREYERCMVTTSQRLRDAAVSTTSIVSSSARAMPGSRRRCSS